MYISREPVWVLVDGQLHNVSEFAKLSLKDRPTAFCPKCDSKVILKLGRVRRHHYAHKEDVECKFISEPETLLHYNTKMYFKEILANFSSLYVETECINCGKPIRFTWFSNWDEVTVEFRIESKIDYIIADVALMRDGILHGIIEVYVTHRVDQGKINFLEKKFIRCLEFEATNEFIDNSENWTPDIPLPHLNLVPQIPVQRCEECNIKYKKWLKEIERKEKIAELARKAQKARELWQLEQAKKKEEENQRRLEQERLKKLKAYNNRTVITAVMMVDFYYHSGKRDRQRYMLQRKYKDNVWMGARVLLANGKPLFSETGSPIEEQNINFLSSQLNEYIKSISEDTKTIFEHHIVMNWEKIEETTQSPHMISQIYDLYFLPKYVYDEDKGIWILNPEEPISL